MRPSEHVLDLFAVPGDVEPAPGGRGQRIRAGDLVLSPGRDPAVLEALNPVLARLAVDLDTRAHRDRRDLRVAVPVPARDGRWTVEGWGATRHEPGAQVLTDLPATRAVGAILHAELAGLVTHWPPAGSIRDDRWGRAERLAFARTPVGDGRVGTATSLVTALSAARDDTPLGPQGLVHGDLMGSVLLDRDGAPVVVDVSPYWRPALWAEAVCVLDALLWFDADPRSIGSWLHGPARQAMVRAGLFRLLTDQSPDVASYERVLAPVLGSLHE